MRATNIFFFLIFLYLFKFFQNCKQLVYLTFFFIKLLQYHWIYFLANANADISFRFFKNKLNYRIESSFHFFLTLTCNFIAAKDKRKDDDENALNDCFDWKVSTIIWRRLSTTVFRDDNIFSFAKNDFNFSYKISFVCSLMIFEADCSDKFKKRITN